MEDQRAEGRGGRSHLSPREDFLRGRVTGQKLGRKSQGSDQGNEGLAK